LNLKVQATKNLLKKKKKSYARNGSEKRNTTLHSMKRVGEHEKNVLRAKEQNQRIRKHAFPIF
jgi:hypothetical protein